MLRGRRWRRGSHRGAAYGDSLPDLNRVVTKRSSDYGEDTSDWPNADTVQAIEAAVALYTGELLAGLYALIDAARWRGEQTAQAVVAHNERLLDLTRHVVAHVQGEQVPANEKLDSLFEPHTAIIRKGKAGKPVEFGRVLRPRLPTRGR